MRCRPWSEGTNSQVRTALTPLYPYNDNIRLNGLAGTWFLEFLWMFMTIPTFGSVLKTCPA
eukprot:scaffold565726_cov27-Prasinocladus_malaysianus.AAC.1